MSGTTYRTIVGNIGTVYDGPDASEAQEAWSHYVRQSRSGIGRASNEDVTLLVTHPNGNEDVLLEHYGHDPEEAP